MDYTIHGVTKSHTTERLSLSLKSFTCSAGKKCFSPGSGRFNFVIHEVGEEERKKRGREREKGGSRGREGRGERE